MAYAIYWDGFTYRIFYRLFVFVRTCGLFLHTKRLYCVFVRNCALDYVTGIVLHATRMHIIVRKNMVQVIFTGLVLYNDAFIFFVRQWSRIEIILITAIELGTLMLHSTFRVVQS